MLKKKYNFTKSFNQNICDLSRHVHVQAAGTEEGPERRINCQRLQWIQMTASIYVGSIQPHKTHTFYIKIFLHLLALFLGRCTTTLKWNDRVTINNFSKNFNRITEQLFYPVLPLLSITTVMPCVHAVPARSTVCRSVYWVDRSL